MILAPKTLKSTTKWGDPRCVSLSDSRSNTDIVLAGLLLAHVCVNSRYGTG